MCFSNSILSTSSGKDRLDVFYQLDLATASGKDRLDSRSLGGSSLDPRPSFRFYNG